MRRLLAWVVPALLFALPVMAEGPDAVTSELAKAKAEYAMAQEASMNARREYEQAKLSREETWPKILQPMATALLGVCTILSTVYMGYHINIKNARIKDNLAREEARRRLAADLLNQFIAGEFYIKARLISQEYLIEGGSYFRLSVKEGKKLNLVEVGTILAARPEKEHQEARFYIRAIPSFFWMIDQIHEKSLILENETIFDAHYTWYWVHVIEKRLDGCGDDRMFRKLDWMIKPDLEIKIRREYADLLYKFVNCESSPEDSLTKHLPRNPEPDHQG